jgi:hypothetical protein
VKREHGNRFFALLARVEVIWLAIAVLSLTLCFVVTRLAGVDHATCVRVSRINAQIEVSLHRSLKSIPTIAYYKNHPEELAKVIDQTQEQIELFRPVSCD